MDANFTIADAASLTIAMVAVTISVWSGYLTRRHNRLSVIPRFRISHRFRNKVDSYGVRLINAGLGPGIVKEIDLFLDGSPVAYSHQGWVDSLREIGFKSDDWAITRLLKGTALRSGEEVWLIHSSTLPEETNSVIRRLSRLEVVVHYESIYEEDMPIMRGRLGSDDLLIENCATIEASPNDSLNLDEPDQLAD